MDRRKAIQTILRSAERRDQALVHTLRNFVNR